VKLAVESARWPCGEGGKAGGMEGSGGGKQHWKMQHVVPGIAGMQSRRGGKSIAGANDSCCVREFMALTLPGSKCCALHNAVW
jgi:hypothetical protein